MNPSYVERTLLKHWEFVHAGSADLLRQGLQALQWKAFHQDCGGTLQQAIRKLDLYSREVYEPYYRPFKKLAADACIGDAWEHLDLLPIRVTDQSALLKSLGLLKGDTEKCEEAFKLMVKATMTLVKAIQPSVVLVANAAASRLLTKQLGLQLQANGHRYDCPHLSGIPFLLSSQLSGGATSEYARQRLVADLKDVLKGGSGLS